MKTRLSLLAFASVISCATVLAPSSFAEGTPLEPSVLAPSPWEHAPGNWQCEVVIGTARSASRVYQGYGPTSASAYEVAQGICSQHEPAYVCGNPSRMSCMRL